MPLAPGTFLGPYEILQPIGSGGMGDVYRARDSRLDRHVAIKVLPEHLARDPEALGRFEREAKAVAALSHPNILAIHDFASDQGVWFAVTELLEGETLRGRVDAGPLAWRKAVETAMAVADGLSAAHAKGIIHRDLKPDNIFLTSDGRVKILDFGLARWRDASSHEGAARAETEPGTVLGTVNYMSPEQVRGIQADPPSDIFSLGCVIYEMVAGKQAFSRSSGAETMAAILHDEPPELTSSGKRIPQDVDRVIRHCLEKNPHERFQSARDLAFALKALLADSATVRAASPRSKRTIDALAVLPFTNASGDPNADYLSDGITESLINGLSQLPKLRIVARSVVFRYKGRDADPQTIGQELNVRALLTGRVMQRGENLNVQAELVDVASGSQLWGEQYNRKFADIFAVQEEIAQQISDKLRFKLTGDEKKRLSKRHTQNSEAYQLYLKGRYYWNRRLPDRVKKGIEYFQQAIEQDPNFAPAYAGIADCYGSLVVYGAVAPHDAFPKIKAAAAKALDVDENLAEAHTSMGFAKTFYDWDWKGAEREFQRAFELKLNYAPAHHYCSLLYTVLSRSEEAVAESKMAQEIEPLSIAISSGVALAYYYARRYDEAMQESRRTIELDPSFIVAYFCLGLAEEQKGMYTEAIASHEKAVQVGPGIPRSLAALGHAYALAGQSDRARKIIDELNQASSQRYIPPVEVVPIYAALGEVDHLFEWIDKACEDRSLWLACLPVDPRLAGARSDPRFQTLLRRLNLSS